MRRLGENRWEDTERSWQGRGVSLQDMQKASGKLLERMISWALWQRILFLVAVLAALAAVEILFSLYFQGWPSEWISRRMMVLPGYCFLALNCLFLFWLSTFPKWELEKRKKLAGRFTTITFIILLLVMAIAVFLTVAHFEMTKKGTWS